MSTTSSSSSFFPTAALDHAFAGIGAGTVAVLCMQPLDLLKVKFQVANDPKQRPSLNPLKEIWRSLKGIHGTYGWQGLYRGLGANVAGNAASWGLYFWLCVRVHGRSAAKDMLLKKCFQIASQLHRLETAYGRAGERFSNCAIVGTKVPTCVR